MSDKYEPQNKFKHAKAGMEKGEVWQGVKKDQYRGYFFKLEEGELWFFFGEKWIDCMARPSDLDDMNWTRCEIVEEEDEGTKALREVGNEFLNMGKEEYKKLYDSVEDEKSECEHSWWHDKDGFYCAKCDQRDNKNKLTPEMLNGYWKHKKIGTIARISEPKDRNGDIWAEGYGYVNFEKMIEDWQPITDQEVCDILNKGGE